MILTGRRTKNEEEKNKSKKNGQGQEVQTQSETQEELRRLITTRTIKMNKTNSKQEQEVQE